MMGLLSSLVVAGATLVGLVILGVVFLIGVRLMRPAGRAAPGGDADEVRLLQEIHRSLERLESRVDTLETVVLDARSKGRGPCDT